MKAEPSKAGVNEVFDRIARPLRILVVGPSFDILGGQSVQAARLISRLRELPSFEVGFLAINPRLPGALRKLQAVKYLRTVVTSLLYVTNLLRRVPKFDVIHIFSASYFSFVLAPTPAILVGKLFGKKVLLNYHSGEAEDHLKRWRRTAVPTIRLADQVAVPSEYLVKVFGQFGIQARAINNLIELEKFAFRERNPLRPRFLSNRNLEKHYGVDTILRAFALIQSEFPDAGLVVAGDGSQRAPLQILATDLGLRNAMFIGRIEPERIVEQYQSADIYLNGSEIDNQPLSILEAFACGLPVVTTDAGGIPDMVTDGRTGFVVGHSEHESMADRALRLIKDPVCANSIVQTAREECAKYTWPAVREQWTNLYTELANQKLIQDPPSKGRLGKLIHKARQMSIDELRVRSSQAFAALAERQGWSQLTKLPSDQTLLALMDAAPGESEFESVDDLRERFRSGSKGFFPAFDDADALVAELRSRWPEAEKEIIDAADRIIVGRFDLLGLRDLSFGAQINWHLEPISGKSAPPLHWSRIDYLAHEVTGDKKIVWELNRHQYFVKLGQAYWLTRDEKYARMFVAHLDSWMDQNPPKVGINWASSLEIAFRSISWLWAFHFFQNSPALSSGTFARALKFLYLNGRHLETYLSTYFSPNTHLTGEALGLFYLGTLLPEFKDAARWRAKGQKILVEQLARQVKPDGVYFEQSSYYQRYTADFYTHLLILSQASAPSASADASRLSVSPQSATEVETKLTALLDHLMYITRPDGTSPLVGDDDGGKLVMLDRRRANDFRATLSTAAAFFSRGDYKFVAGELAEETLWLLGPKGARAFDEIAAQEPAAQSRDFPDGGYYVMRDGWDSRANYLFFDCGPHGADNCGHAHADALSIEVSASGQPMLIDPGTYTYTGSKDLRDWFRGSSAHNVLMVDGEPSSVPAGPFSWKTIAKCETLSWINERRFDFVESRHDGYERLAAPATHNRSILFLKNDYWLIRDRLISSGNHRLDLKFHFAPGSNPQPAPQRNCFGGNPAQLESMNPGVEGLVEAGENASLQIFALGQGSQWSREEGWSSHCYGERVAAPVCTFSANTSASSSGQNELITLLLPSSGKMPSFKVREVEAIGGRAFEIENIENDSHSDLVVLRDPGGSRVETVRLVSDFKWTWARFSRNGGAMEDLLELLVMDGQQLELDGKEILKSAKRINYLVASRTGNRFHVETSEGLLNLSFPIGDLERLLAESIRPQSVPPALAGGYSDPGSKI